MTGVSDNAFLEMETIKSLFQKTGYSMIHHTDNSQIYSKKGGLGSTYIFALLEVSEESYLEEIESSLHWVIENVLDQNSLAQIGFNAILISEHPLTEKSLRGLTDSHAINDMDNFSLSPGRLLSNIKDVIFQTVISYGYKTKRFNNWKTWILLGSVRSTFISLCDTLKQVSL